MRTAGVVAVMAATVSCLPVPALRFFTPPPHGQNVIGTVTDTVFVLRYGVADSASADGVRLAHDLLDRARATDRRDVAAVVQGVLDAVPEADRVREAGSGSLESDIVRRVQGRNWSSQMDLMRADVVTIQEVVADTVEADGVWLALILTGAATLDPTMGLRMP